MYFKEVNKEQFEQYLKYFDIETFNHKFYHLIEDEKVLATTYLEVGKTIEFKNGEIKYFINVKSIKYEEVNKDEFSFYVNKYQLDKLKQGEYNSQGFHEYGKETYFNDKDNITKAYTLNNFESKYYIYNEKENLIILEFLKSII